MKKILVIAAHPDDEILGAGGTIAALAKKGSDIHILILGEGLTSRDEKRQPSKRKPGILSLKDQAERANDLLGVRGVSVHDLPDNRFDTIALLDIVKLIEKEIEEWEPEVVFTHSNSDLNIDHTITHRAVLTATRPLKDCPVREIYAFETPSSTEWAFGQFGQFSPQTFINVKDTIESKIEAMEIYESETREFPHPRSAEALMVTARRWGSTVGLEYAEAFETLRRIL